VCNGGSAMRCALEGISPCADAQDVDVKEPASGVRLKLATQAEVRYICIKVCCR
jgi:hypothetical protein